tara:strand:+ start:810 stop:1559 length:750 start_codon:yes stop_codon:yes gene_type:complete
LKVSIITATYNREKTIYRAISSIKNQDYNNIQTVVIDGKSSDKTISTIKPLLNSNDILRSEADNGIYDALNKGLKYAEGDIIGFLHSDDLFYDKNVISTVVKSFYEKKANVVFGDACFFKSNNIDKIVRRYISKELSIKRLAWGKMPAHPAIFIKRNIYEEIGNFDSSYKIAGDYEFICRLARYPQLKSIYLKQILIKMQMGGASTSGLKSSILLNHETMKALKTNNIYSNLFMLFSKYPSKIMEFIFK